jgi:hypothetical protein
MSRFPSLLRQGLALRDASGTASARFSRWLHNDDEAEAEEAEVVAGFAVAAGGDAEKLLSQAMVRSTGQR